MANWHVVVYDNTKRKDNIVYEKEFFEVGAANAMIKEKREVYPKPQFLVTKEKY